jgi:hypothetical protein
MANGATAIVCLAVGLGLGVCACGAGADARPPVSGDFTRPDAATPVVCTPECRPDLTCDRGQCVADKPCRADDECPGGTMCGAEGRCVPGGRCGIVQPEGVPVPSNMLLVLDRSCSMRTSVGGEPKWAHAVRAIHRLTTTHAGKIRFGLMLFPDTSGDKCSQETITLPVAPDSEASIQQLLTNALSSTDANHPSAGPCVTPIDTAIQKAASDPALGDPGRGSYVVLITDGQQSGCYTAGGDRGTMTTIAGLYTRKVPTFVIGFSSGIDGDQLGAFAKAGGTDRKSGAPAYYLAEDGPGLDAALQTIARKAYSCTFQLSTPPPDPGRMYVYFDKRVDVPRDTSRGRGWDYDAQANAVVFYGDTCDDLRLAKVSDVDIVFGCPTAIK